MNGTTTHLQTKSCTKSIEDVTITFTPDANNRYLQIENCGKRERTAFDSHHILYYFVREPSRLRNAHFFSGIEISDPIPWQIESLCNLFKRRCSHSEGPEKHILHVPIVLTLLKKAGVALN